MRNTIAKRIRRNNRNEFPRTNETPQEYKAQIRELSKEDKSLLNDTTAKLTQPKIKASARQQRISNGKKFGFPVGSVTLFAKRRKYNKTNKKRNTTIITRLV